MDLHHEQLGQELNEAPAEPVQEEEYSDEEEEEEDAHEAIDSTVLKSVTDELENIDPEIDIAELEHRLYQRIAESRLEEDYEDIMKIVRIISGQWRSGHFRHQTDNTVNEAFVGNETERRRFEQKRKSRNEKRARQAEARSAPITSGTIHDMIERCIWLRLGSTEDATEMDRLRMEACKRDADPTKRDILERLEMEQFLKEQRAKEAAKERRSEKTGHFEPVSRTQSSFDVKPPRVPPKAADMVKRYGSYTFIIKDRAPEAQKPEKRSLPKKLPPPSPELVDFLRRVRSSR
jgi:hypothetical protein